MLILVLNELSYGFLSKTPMYNNKLLFKSCSNRNLAIRCQSDEREKEEKIEIEFDVINEIPSSSSSSNNSKGSGKKVTTSPQGYLNSDMRKMGEEKQSRVLAYILIALLPCLFLVPFFMNRDFVPPID